VPITCAIVVKYSNARNFGYHLQQLSRQDHSFRLVQAREEGRG
jgi:hypothetical protein